MDILNRHSRSHIFTFRLYSFMVGFVFLSVMAWFFHTIPPKEGSMIVVGIILILVTIFCFLYSLIKNVRHVLLISSGVGVLLILRSIGLHDWLYVLLLLAILISLEYAWSKR